MGQKSIKNLCGTKDLNETSERSHASKIGKKGGVVNSWYRLPDRQKH